ncbi:MAG: hypothetical protein ACR2I2_07885 [Bryobacteraceae bacterium]
MKIRVLPKGPFTRRRFSDQSIYGKECSFVPDGAYSFTVGAVDMIQFIQSSLQKIPSVKSVSVSSNGTRVSVDVAVNSFAWATLEPIYEKELDLSNAFPERPLDFRVIDESLYTGEAANIG